MHLVSLVIAGEGIHHEIDAEAVGHFLLTRPAYARAFRIARRPGRAPIIRADDNG